MKAHNCSEIKRMRTLRGRWSEGDHAHWRKVNNWKLVIYWSGWRCYDRWGLGKCHKKVKAGGTHLLEGHWASSMGPVVCEVCGDVPEEPAAHLPGKLLQVFKRSQKCGKHVCLWHHSHRVITCGFKVISAVCEQPSLSRRCIEVNAVLWRPCLDRNQDPRGRQPLKSYLTTPFQG